MPSQRPLTATHGHSRLCSGIPGEATVQANGSLCICSAVSRVHKIYTLPRQDFHFRFCSFLLRFSLPLPPQYFIRHDLILALHTIAKVGKILFADQRVYTPRYLWAHIHTAILDSRANINIKAALHSLEVCFFNFLLVLFLPLSKNFMAIGKLNIDLKSLCVYR